MSVSNINENDLYNSFANFVMKLASTFHTKEDAIAQRNTIQRWTEFVALFDLFSEKLRILGKQVPNREFLVPLLIELGSNCIENDAHQYNEAYLELERCMTEPSDDPRVWCYLYPMECSTKLLDFDGPLRIRKATILELAFHRQNRYSMGRISTYIAETKPGFVQSSLNGDFVRTDKAEFHVNMPIDPPFGDDFFTLVSILRLVKPSPIGYDSLILQETNDKVSYSAVYHVSPWKQPCQFGVIGHLQSNLSKDETDELGLLWEYYQSAIQSLKKKKASRLKRAIRRYELVICSNEIEDAIVDSIISLETLFEVGGREMVHRASNLIGSTEKARKLTKGILENARKMRNSVVHGGTPDSSYENVNHYLLPILRHILVCAIVLSKKGDWFADLIDNSITDAIKMSEVKRTISKWLMN